MNFSVSVFILFAGVDVTDECQRKWSFLETMAREREKDRERADEKNGSVVNPISFGVNCDSSRTTVFWYMNDSAKLSTHFVEWCSYTMLAVPRHPKSISNIFLRLHLFAMMSFRLCDHGRGTQPHSHRLMMQTTSICVGRCGDVSNIRYLRSLSLLQRFAAGRRHWRNISTNLSFSAAKGLLSPFSHFSLESWISWHWMGYSEHTHTHTPTLAY